MEIGIIGLGDMGLLYAKEFSQHGYHVNGCDLPENRDHIEGKLQGTGVKILDDGIAVSRRSDLIIYSVEAENIEKVVSLCGPSTKQGAVVAGQTSVKTPEIEAFERYLPDDVHIVTCHSLHGPSLSPVGQLMAVINHRSTTEAYQRARETFASLGSTIVDIPSYQEHDRITADTQVNTHLCYESMGTGWKNAGIFPWLHPSYVNGIDNVKTLMALRVYGGKAHVYSGLAMMNPFAKRHVQQYALSESELFKAMIQEDEQQFKDRIQSAGRAVFQDHGTPPLVDAEVMGTSSLAEVDSRKPNSHLSLLAMVDAWHKLGVNPYENLICQTPLFRLRLGIAEYLFRNEALLEESLNTALFDKSIRGDDLEFHTAVREWAALIEHKDTDGYREQFDDTKAFFKDLIPDGMKRSNALIERVMQHQVDSLDAER